MTLGMDRDVKNMQIPVLQKNSSMQEVLQILPQFTLVHFQVKGVLLNFDNLFSPREIPVFNENSAASVTFHILLYLIWDNTECRGLFPGRPGIN